MRVWAIANQKGGVGKTTTTVTLGGILAQWGLRTLLVDMDPHGSLSSYFKVDPEAVDRSVYSLFKAKADHKRVDPYQLITKTNMQGLGLLPASVALATLDRQIGQMDGMGLVLNEALHEISRSYSYVLVDCPPMLGVLMINALAACERLIIPVQTEYLALKGLERMVKTLSMILRSRPEPIPYIVIPTFFDRRVRASFSTLETLRDDYFSVLWDEVIPVDTQFREASRAGLPPPLYSPRSRGVIAYSRLLEVLLESTSPSVAQGVVA